MTFILRQISERATGGQIVRQREVASATLTIGRGADCDIRLQDLAVSLRHATVSREGDGHLRILAAGDQPFGVNGRFVKDTRLKLEDGARLTFGDHQIVVALEGAAVMLTTTRVEALAAVGPIGAGDAEGLAPNRRWLGKRAQAWTGLGLIGLLCILVPVLAMNGGLDRWLSPRIDPDAQWSSGPLSMSHAFLEDDCQSCHQEAFVSVRDTSCLTCHSDKQTPAMVVRTNAEVQAAGATESPGRVADHAGLKRLEWGAPPPSDLGGRIFALARQTFNRPEQRCAACHVEHVANPLTEARAEVPTLQTTHTCVACHADLDDRLKDTDLQNTPDWPGHPELRPTITTWPGPGPARVQRVSMASRPHEATGLVFPHALHMSATGTVARMAQTLPRYGQALDCASCHVPKPGDDNYRPVEMETACGSCHSLAFAARSGTRQIPHGESAAVVSFLTGAYARGDPVTGATNLGPRRRPGERTGAALSAAPSASQRVQQTFSRGGACFDCHTTSGTQIAPVHIVDAYLTRGAFNHRVLQHRQDAAGRPTCTTCHAAGTSTRSSDLLLPRLSVCADCHGAEPSERIPATSVASADCATCHSYHAPSRPAPTDETHREVAGLSPRTGARMP
jgi:Zn finger protein HypA/HybF involved in hydrogenase expression